MFADGDHPHRRHYERDVDPTVETFVEQRLRETRHELRNEFTAASVGIVNQIAALSKTVAEGQLQATREHAEVNGRLSQLQRDVGVLQPLAGRVTVLEGAEAADLAVSVALKEFKQGLDRKFYAMAGLLVAAVGVVVAVFH